MPPIFDLSQILEPRHEVLGDVNLQRHPREVGDSSHAKGPQAAGGGLRSRLQPGFHVPLAPVLTVGVGHSSPPFLAIHGDREERLDLFFSRGGYTPPVIARRDWVTTAEVAEAAGVHATTLARWVKVGLLPERVHLNLGRRGRAYRWPPHTLEQARWVKARIEDMWTLEEIRAALERGDFKPSVPTPAPADED